MKIYQLSQFFQLGDVIGVEDTAASSCNHRILHNAEREDDLFFQKPERIDADLLAELAAVKSN